MLTAQADHGYINSIGQYNIANLDSLTKATKPGPFLQNDSYAINSWTKMLLSLNSTTEGERFEDFFPDEDIANYRNVNGLHLKGMRAVTDENGNRVWRTIDRNDPSLTLEDQKNFVKHSIISKAAAKLAGMINRNISPTVLDNMKPDGMEALRNLVSALSTVALENVDEDIEFENKLNPDPDYNIFKAQDPSILRRELSKAKAMIDQRTSNSDSSIDSTLGLGDQLSTPSTNSSTDISSAILNASSALAKLGGQLQRYHQSSPQPDLESIQETINDIFTNPTDFEVVVTNLLNVINNSPSLAAHIDEFNRIIDEARFSDLPSSSDDSINQITHQGENEQARLDALQQAIQNLIDQYYLE